MQKTVLIIISGSIAAYKALDIIRHLKKQAIKTIPIVTKSALAFIAPLSVASIAKHPVYQDLFSLKDETEMGHITLAREADLILVAPASADLMAKHAHGLADDLASTLLLAADAPVMMAPAMNSVMWQHPATQSNLNTLKEYGVKLIAPSSGELACGEEGIGRLASVETIAQAVLDQLG